MVYDYIFVFLLAFIGVYNLTPLMIKIAHVTNFMDNPEARKVHKKAMPLLGGLSVFIGFIALAVYDIAIAPERTFDRHSLGFFTGAVIIVLTGLIDDRRPLKPGTKMIGQILACLVFLYFNNLLRLFPIHLPPMPMHLPIVGDFNPGSWNFSFVVLLFWMVGLMNAFNFLDNMDGILSGMSGILSLGFFILSLLAFSPSLAPVNKQLALLSITFSGAVLGFLPHNFNPAKIFLGDTGSMFIGYFLGAMGILCGQISAVKMNSHLWYLVPILLLSYAIFDISLVSYTRKRDGRHIMQGGKDHSTHRINNATGSTRVTALLIYLINFIITLTTVLVFKAASSLLLVITTLIVTIGFLFFGHKLDEVPVVISQNQLKKKQAKA